MTDVVDHIKAGDFLLTQQVHRLALLFAKDGNQHIAAADFLAAGGLHVEDGTLQHTLESECRLSVTLLVMLGKNRRGSFNIVHQASTQTGNIRSAMQQHIDRQIIVQQ